jgi:hypothetical protein
MNKEKLDKYIQPRKRSVLAPYLDEIRYLVERGATQKSILAYLKNEEGVEVTQSYLSRFIKRYITSGDFTPKRTSGSKLATQSSNAAIPNKESPKSKSTRMQEPKNPEDDISKEERNKKIEEMIKRNQNALGKWV